MREIKTSKPTRIGIPPGTPVTFSGESKEPVKITVFEYTEKECRKIEVGKPEDCADFTGNHKPDRTLRVVSWFVKAGFRLLYQLFLKSLQPSGMGEVSGSNEI